MCRWLAYSGEPLQPATVVLDAQHSIVKQALNSPLGAETVNGDGFGKVTMKQVAAVRDVLFDNGAIKKQLDPSKYYTAQFLDEANNFDHEAIKKLAQSTH